MAAATDSYTGPQKAIEPAEHVALPSLSDSADLTYVTRGISFAVAGDIKVNTVGGETVVIPSGALAPGIVHPLRVSRIWSTGTGATGLVVYW